ncbi:MAG: carboxypeptidase regulatory-like domain-containing protein [Myxococcota bacterium]
MRPRLVTAIRSALGSLAAVLATSLALHGQTARAGDEARVEGTLRVELDGIPFEAAGEVVVFLETTGSDAPERDRRLAERPRPTERIRQSGARFEPSMLVVSRGQKIEMPNDDVIYHNVFSYSEPNDFDLGMYASGESRTLRFDHAGLVRIYCSIHDDMDGLIFVAPSPLFAVPDATGRFAIERVPAGDYRLRVWSERLPEVATALRVEAGGARRVEISIGQPDASR